MKDTVLGVGRNALAPNVPQAFLESCKRIGLEAREIDFSSLRVDVQSGILMDYAGEIRVTHLAPALFYWADVAVDAYSFLEQQGVQSLNQASCVLIADDKARTAVALSKHSVPQLRTVVTTQSEDHVLLACEQLGFPCVLKRTHGAQGRWVKKVDRPEDVVGVLTEFAAEGPSAIIVQELATTFVGKSIRVLVLGENVIASTLREGAPGSFVSNISAGGKQTIIELTEEEISISIAAVKAIGLGFAGVDLCRHQGRSFVLEVNACPDFTSMIPFFGHELVDKLLTFATQ